MKKIKRLSLPKMMFNESFKWIEKEIINNEISKHSGAARFWELFFGLVYK